MMNAFKLSTQNLHKISVSSLSQHLMKAPAVNLLLCIFER